MRLLLTADPALPVPPKLYGGIERIVNLLIEELVARGHTVGLVAHPDSQAPALHLWPWQGLESQSLWDSLQNIQVLQKAVTEFKPDLIHSFSRLLYLLPHLGKATPKLMSYQRFPGARQIRWATVLSRHSLAFTGCSDYICNLGRQGGGKWHTIHNCVSLKTYTFQPGVPHDAPLVYLSRIEPIKGTHLAIAMARQAGRPLLIAGNYSTEGENGRYWEEQIKPHLGRDSIEYVGPVDDIQKDQLLGQAAALVVPIQWDEPFGIVFIEALACGTPVIATPRGALPEIVRPGIDGFLVTSIDQGVDAVQNLGQIHRADCRQRVETQFSSGVITSRYEALYTSLLRQDARL